MVRLVKKKTIFTLIMDKNIHMSTKNYVGNGYNLDPDWLIIFVLVKCLVPYTNQAEKKVGGGDKTKQNMCSLAHQYFPPM